MSRQKWALGLTWTARQAAEGTAHQRGEGQAGNLTVALVGHWSLFWTIRRWQQPGQEEAAASNMTT